jgi:class 3 adenylate cyclase
MRGGQHILVDNVGKKDAVFKATADGWTDEELTIQANSPITLENRTGVEQLFIIERLSWSDQGATAAEVTAMQLFRDLFANEALRASAQFSVGSLTMMFTDLRDSTALYREVGDAPAFGMVLSHFDVLRDAINAENGAIVKTNGDAAMAVFRRPINAIRAAVAAQRKLASQTPAPGKKPLSLKVGIHTGSCIAVNLNDRLDYFGTTVNIAARLEALSTGDDIVMSEAVYTDPEVVEFFSGDPSLGITPFGSTLKGFENSVFELWRLSTSQSTIKTLE